MEWIIVIPIIYLFLLLGLALEAHTMPKIIVDEHDADLTAFSIIINFRNEAQHLPMLLDSISKLNYDFEKLEFLFVNDDSTDTSLEILQKFRYQNPRINIQIFDRKPLSASAKKDGITQAIAVTKHDYIITTDADCIVPEKWLLGYHHHYLQFSKTLFISGPITMEHDSSFLTTLQSHETVALQVMTMGAFQIKRPFMANGANMSFKKDAFYEVKGFEGNTHISSGDDVFLLEKLWQLNSEHCHYLKTAAAAVSTFPKRSWRKTIAQRARWAQKGSETSSLLNKAVGFQVLVMSLLFLIAPLLFLFDLITFPLLVGLFIIKISTDVLVLFIGHQFFQQFGWTRFLLLQIFVYPVMVICVAIASLSKPEWSNRRINQLEVPD